MNESEMRLDPLRHTWTIFSTARMVAPTALSRKKVDGESPFVPGREHLVGRAIYSNPPDENWEVRVVPNRAPAVHVEGEPRCRADGFYDRMTALGAHEVIIESRSGKDLDELSLSGVSRVVTAWRWRMNDLLRDHRLRSFLISMDAGDRAGGQTACAVSQLIAMSVVPAVLRQKLESARDHYERKRRSIFEDILEEEIRVGKRLVYENNGFSVICPYASRRPFELLFLPKRQNPDFHRISDEEVAQLSDALHIVLAKLNLALDFPPYNLMVYTAPTRTGRRDHWNTIEDDFRWHIELMPRQFFSGGFEIASGCYLNTVWPETCADFLRKVDL
jgi:UDPglucose--hexose-1-phosphate uridylyltransferase